jgi:hypothetical protein
MFRLRRDRPGKRARVQEERTLRDRSANVVRTDYPALKVFVGKAGEKFR